MGLFDIFRAGPSKEAILGQVRKAKEIYAQPEYRRMAMENLLKWGTAESLSGLLERFSVVVQFPHWDEEEKRWLVEELIKIGEQALPLLREFILKRNEVNHALLAFRKIVANDEAYKERYGTENPNLPAYRALKEAGVGVYICGQSLIARGIETEEVWEDATLALSMLTTLTTYVPQGYMLMKF